MSSRGKQLLLEVLLLAERYSDRDVAWVRSQLSAYPRGANVLELLGKPLEKLGKSLGAQKQANHAPASAESRRVLFVKGLRKTRSSHSLRRAENVAARLQIKLTGQSHEELIQEIERALSNFDENQLLKFLRPYKASGGVDEAYIGLANTLMRPEKQD